MKKIVLSCALSLALCSALNAYELNGNLDVKWTGFKTEKKVGVSGSFKDINLSISKEDSLTKFLKSAKVTINALSFDSKDPFRDKNITSTLFSLKSSQSIKGSIIEVNEKKNKLVLKLTLNEVTKNIIMSFKNEKGQIKASGTLDILDFAMEKSYLAFAKKCAGFHANKSYSDVNIDFTLPYK